MNEQEIYLEALAREDPTERRRYLDEACRGDRAVRDRLDKLFRHAERVENFLESPPVPVAVTADRSWIFPAVGTMVGPYKVREQLAEGGMGVVYVAEQTEPVRRKVALKIIKPGMATKDVITRFEAERQALAMMDHPNIARVFDGGETAPTDARYPGQPYFVMELVLGTPITDFCDEQKSTTRERLQLFLKVCQAVQHAHQRGIIHRDIKPSNVLVAEIDSGAVPKVIDFGVAKAVSQKLTERTVYTQVSQMIGTPLYMSPEQAAKGVADVDTRSDVYSLGVLLYELLTGCTPFNQERLRQADYGEMQRIIREDEPPRPSAMVSTLKADAVSTVSEKRRSDPRRFGDSLRGELDWIVMKCLEKDRNRRYESASALAADVQHYLDGAPVLACPPSVSYRLLKMARQHRAALAFAVSILLALSIGLGIALWQAARARGIAAEERRARQQAQANLQMAIDAVTDMYKDVAADWLASGEALTPVQTTYSQKALDFYTRLIDDPHQYNLSQQQTAEMTWQAALLLRKMGRENEAFARLKSASSSFAAALEGREASASDASLELLADMYNLSGVLADELGHRQTAKELFVQADAVCEQLAQRPSAVNSARIKQSYVANNLSNVYEWEGDLELAERELRRALDIVEQLGPQVLADAGATFNALGFRGNLSGLLLAQGKEAEAEELSREALADTRKKLVGSPDDRRLREAEAYLLWQVTRCLVYKRKFDEAELILEELLPLQVDQLSIATEPPNFLYAQLMGMPNRFPGYEEPQKWSDWIRSYLMLAEVKNELGQPIAAEIFVGRVAVTADFLQSLYPDNPRHLVDQANVLATTAWILQGRHPEEAKLHALLAAKAWQGTLGRFPARATKPSQLRPGTSDFEWFVEQFPAYDFRQSDLTKLTGHSAPSRWLKTRVQALVSLDFGESPDEMLASLVKQQPSPEPYDLLTLSLTLARSKRMDEARQRYREAIDLLGVDSSPEPIVAARQKQVAALLEEEE